MALSVLWMKPLIAGCEWSAECARGVSGSLSEQKQPIEYWPRSAARLAHDAVLPVARHIHGGAEEK